MNDPNDDRLLHRIARLSGWRAAMLVVAVVSLLLAGVIVAVLIVKW